MKFLDRIRASVSSFMSGRYGVDQLGYSMIITALIVSVIGSLTKITLLVILADIVLILAFVRILSKERYKRQNENMIYLQKTAKMRQWLTEHVNRLKNMRQYHYYHCPQCKELYRVPRGKGNIVITCKKCGTKFDKKA